jgi:hypothetical protein
MIPPKRYAVCRTCDIPHYSNCDTCYGFGVYSDCTPVTAEAAHDRQFISDVKPCPQCGSTQQGIPIRC